MSKRLKTIPKFIDQIRKIAPEYKGLRDIDIIEIVLREKIFQLGFTPEDYCFKIGQKEVKTK